jgi:hypothetical protein
MGLCWLIDKAAQERGCPLVSRLACCATACCATPVWWSFRAKAMVDVPALCCSMGVLVLVLRERLTPASVIAASSVLVHPIAALGGLGAVAGRSFRHAVNGVLLCGCLLVPVLWWRGSPAPGEAVGAGHLFRSALDAQGSNLFSSAVTQWVYAVGPLTVVPFLSMPKLRNVLLAAVGGFLATLTISTGWIRLAGHVGVLFTFAAFDARQGDWWRRGFLSLMAAATGMALFLWPLSTAPFQPPRAAVGGVLLLLSTGLLIASRRRLSCWRLWVRPSRFRRTCWPPR